MNNRLEEIIKGDTERKYLEKNLPRILYEMENRGAVISTTYNGELHYVFNPEIIVPKVQEEKSTEQKIITDEDRDQEIKDKLHDFLEKNQGSAFTVKTLTNRLDEVIKESTFLSIEESTELSEYIGKNFPRILKEMENRSNIKSKLHDGDMHYYFKQKEIDPKVERSALRLETYKR